MAPSSRYVIADRPGFRLGALLGRWESLLALLLVAAFAANAIVLPHFLDLYNLADGTFNFSEKALIALPMALLIICREIDISVSGILALSSVAIGLAHANGVAPELLLPVAIATGVACGWLNGFMVTHFRLPSIVVTIGTVSLFRGLASVVLGDKAFTGYPQVMADWGQGYFFSFIPRELLFCWPLRRCSRWCCIRPRGAGVFTPSVTILWRRASPAFRWIAIAWCCSCSPAPWPDWRLIC